MPRSIGQVPRTFGLIGPDRPASKGKNARKGHALHVPGPCKGPPLLRRGQRRRPHRNLEPDFQPRLPHDRNAPCGTEKGTLTPDGIVRLSLGRIEGNLDMPQAPHGQALDTFTGGEHAIGVEADTGPGPDGDVHQVPEVPGQQGFAPGLDAQGATRTPPRAQSGWPGSTRSIPRRTVPPPPSGSNDDTAGCRRWSAPVAGPAASTADPPSRPGTALCGTDLEHAPMENQAAQQDHAGFRHAFRQAREGLIRLPSQFVPPIRLARKAVEPSCDDLVVFACPVHGCCLPNASCRSQELVGRRFRLSSPHRDAKDCRPQSGIGP
jgi:hypothetical protein